MLAKFLLPFLVAAAMATPSTELAADGANTHLEARAPTCMPGGPNPCPEEASSLDGPAMPKRDVENVKLETRAFFRSGRIPYRPRSKRTRPANPPPRAKPQGGTNPIADFPKDAPRPAPTSKRTRFPKAPATSKRTRFRKRSLPGKEEAAKLEARDPFRGRRIPYRPRPAKSVRTRPANPPPRTQTEAGTNPVADFPKDKPTVFTSKRTRFPKAPATSKRTRF